MQKILKVVKCSECFTVKSEKAEAGYLYKRSIVLQELGGRFADQYVASLLGNDALCTFSEGEWVTFSEGEWVLASLRFQVREYNGQTFQDVTVTEIGKLKY